MAPIRFLVNWGIARNAMPADLSDDITAFDRMREQLESKSLSRWAVVYDRQLAGTFETFDAAAREAVRKFGRGPYLIRQIGAPPARLPASVLFHPVNANR